MKSIDPRQTLSAARAAFEAGKWARSAELYTLLDVSSAKSNQALKPDDRYRFAVSLRLSGSAASAVPVFARLLKEKLTAKKQLEVLAEFGRTYIELLDFTAAKKVLLRGLHLAKKTPNCTTERVLIQVWLTTVCRMLGEIDESAEYLLDFLEDRPKVKRGDVQCLLLAKLAENYFRTDKNDLALKYVRETESKLRTILPSLLLDDIHASVYETKTLIEAFTTKPDRIFEFLNDTTSRAPNSWMYLNRATTCLLFFRFSAAEQLHDLIDKILHDGTKLTPYMQLLILRTKLSILEKHQRYKEIVVFYRQFEGLVEKSNFTYLNLGIYTSMAIAAVYTDDLVATIDFTQKAISAYRIFIAHFQTVIPKMVLRNYSLPIRKFQIYLYLSRFRIEQQLITNLNLTWTVLSSKLLEMIAIDQQDREMFTATFAHDIGNILHGLKFYSEEDPITVENATQIRSLADKANSYLQFIKNYTVLTTSRPDLSTTATPLLEMVVRDHELAALTAGVKLVNDGGDGKLNGINSEILRETVLSNVLDNAIKFTPTGKTVHIGAIDTPDSIRFYISDEGPGLTDELQRKVKSGQTIHSHPGARNEPGNGVGLILVRKLVERMHGTIRFEAPLTESGGTKVWLEWKH